ncbi:hypothetical protein LEP1GSC036_0457 [Leptospira weilii str. 2006001853]|uniref:Uncharacterized protein n=1 Tax=Leptospira weilii str. 2006001853 TaxID=1001589 RepID=A0A828Z6P7_9LEPT|nr:hypothetical protein LEP1GSC036_0457 [Leptospira weilii str. 2006001853]EMN44775.1 hypothetical protein LEP1GSC086_0689 [Leptospira weilii str. LNT 1234]
MLYFKKMLSFPYNFQVLSYGKFFNRKLRDDYQYPRFKRKT